MYKYFILLLLTMSLLPDAAFGDAFKITLENESPSTIKEFEAILKRYEDQVKKDPDNLALNLAVAEAYYSLRDYPLAVKYYAKAFSLDPKNPRTKLALAKAYLSNHQLKLSQTLFEQLNDETPNDPKIISELGRIEALRHNTFTAENLYQQALELDPSNASTRFYLAELRIEQGLYLEAVRILEELIEASPSAPWLSQALQRAKVGLIVDKIAKLEKKGNFQEAVSLYKKQLAIDPDNIDLYIGLANLYKKMDEIGKSRNLLENALEAHPQSVELKTALAYVYIDTNQLVQAKYLLDNLIKKNVINSDILSGLGRIATLTNQDKLAEEYFLKALKLNSENIAALSFLADLRLKQKQYDDAKKILESILHIQPSALWAKKQIEEVKFAALLNTIKEEEKKNHLKEVERLYQLLLASAPYHTENYIRFGKFYLKQNEREAAIAVYLRGLDLNPKAINLQLALAFLYLDIMELENAKIIFDAVLQKEPENPYALSGLGRVYALIGDPASAARFYQLALLKDPKNITTLSYLADLMMDQNRYREAAIQYQKILKFDPKAVWAKQALIRAHTWPMLEKIKLLASVGQTNEAIFLLHSLIEQDPENVDAASELAALYLQEQRLQEAIKTYQKGLKENPDANQLRVGLGLALLQAHELSKANRVLQTAFAIDPKNSEAIAGLGQIAAATGDIEDAEHLYLLALKIDPTNMFTLSSLAEFWMEQKQFSKAEHLYKTIAKLAPKSFWAKQAVEEAKHGPLLEKIIQQEEKGDPKTVIALYEQLIKEAPENGNYYVKLGQYLKQLGSLDKSIATLNEGLHAFPQSIDLKLALAFAYTEKGDTDKAKELFDAVLKIDLKNSDAITGLGRIKEIQGSLKDAKKQYEKALTINPKNITALTFLADLLFKEGDFKQSKDLYQRLLKYHPNPAWIKLAIEDNRHGVLLAEIKKKEEEKEYQTVELLFNQLLMEAPNQPEYFLRAGLFYHRIKQYDKAIDVYLKGLKIAPSSSSLNAALGLVYLSKKQPTKAKRVFSKALKTDPRNVDALAGLGSAAILNKNYEKAETFILAAMAVDPNNVAALSSLANLRMIQKQYREAEELYAKLMELRPKETWIPPLLDNAKFGHELDIIKELIEEENLKEAAKGYQSLIAKAPNNSNYWWGLGQMYLRLKEYSNAEEAFSKGLEISPEENELLVSLGYAYLFQTNLAKARQILSIALKMDKKNPEALAGLGRVNALEDNTELAEELYKQALAISPINLSTLTFYGDLLMKEKRYPEAVTMFSRLKVLLPKAEWVKRILQDAEDGPVTDIANRFVDREEFEEAAKLFSQLLASLPDDPARYLPLGQMYVNMHQYCRGIGVYQQGLEIDQEVLYLWRAIAYAYIQLADYHTARCIFMYVLSEDPKDAESWAGLGRIEALHGSECLAEEYYAYARELAPKNLTVLSFIADLRKSQLYFFSALEIYSTLMELDCRPKWIRVGYSSLLNLTFATLGVEGAYHQEIQWDPTAHQWSAQYEVFGAKARINYPISDILTLWGQVADQFYILTDFLTHSTIYSFDVQRVHVGAIKVLTPCLFLEASIGLSNYSPYRRGTFFEQSGVFAEPSVGFVIHQPTQKITASISSDSDLIARDFSTRRAKLVGRYMINGSYENAVCRRGWIGIEANAYWYRDYVNNSSQRASGFFQWRPPFYSDHVIFRYQTKYQRFEKNIPDYYTYKAQYINQLQLTLEKSWRVCWADSLYTSLSYGHGWQDTYSRFGQIIVIAPVGTTPSLFWDRRQFNILFANVIYNYDQLELDLHADFYRDTEKYTMWSLIGGVKWRF